MNSSIYLTEAIVIYVMIIKHNAIYIYLTGHQLVDLNIQLDWFILSTISMPDLIVLDLINNIWNQAGAQEDWNFLEPNSTVWRKHLWELRLFNATTRGDSRSFVSEMWKQLKPSSHSMIDNICNDGDNNLLSILLYIISINNK